MIEIHNYSGKSKREDDASDAKRSFEKFGDSQIPTGMTLRDYRDLYNTHIRKLLSFQLIGNNDSGYDKFTEKELMTKFLRPLRYHPNGYVKNLIQDTLVGVIGRPYPTDIDVFIDALQVMIENFLINKK